MALIPRLEPHEDGAEVRLIGACHHAITTDGSERVHPFGFGQDLFNLRYPLTRALKGGGGRWRHVDAEDSLVLFRDETCGERAAEKAGADGYRRYDHDGQYRAPHEQPTASDIAAGRTLKGSVEPAVKLSQGAPRWFWWLQEHGAQRRGERQSAESREQHRDGDGKSELLVHASGKAAQDGHRNDHGGEDERDADDWGRPLFHSLDRCLLGSQPVLEVVHDRFDHDDGVVDDNAKGKHKAEHRKRVH